MNTEAIIRTSFFGTQNSLAVMEIPGPNFNIRSARNLVDAASKVFSNQPTTVVIDLAKVSFIDSLGISILATVYREAPQNTKIVLSGLKDYVQTVARITRLSEVFPIYTTAQSAIDSLSQS